MSKENRIRDILLIIAGVGIIVALGGLSVFYQTQQNQSSAGAEFLKKMSSNAVASIVAYGQVTAIEGRKITVSNQGDSLTVAMRDNAQVSSASQQVFELKDVQVGDNVNIGFRAMPDGSLQGQMILIINK